MENILNGIRIIYLHPEWTGEDDLPNWNGIFYEYTEQYCLDDFEAYTELDSEYYLSLSMFERNLWVYFYLEPMYYVEKGMSSESSYEFYWNNWRTFWEWCHINTLYNQFSGEFLPDGRENNYPRPGRGTMLLGESFKALYQWLYYHFADQYEWINLVIGKNSFQEMGIVSYNEDDESGSLDDGQVAPGISTSLDEDEQIMSIIESMEEERGTSTAEFLDDKGNKSETKSLWSNVGENLKKNKITFIVLAILIVGFVAVLFVRKRKGVDSK